MTQKATLGIFDDHPLTSKGIAHFLTSETDVSILFIKSNKQDLLQQLETELPDVLMLDVLAPDVRGLELFETVLKKYPQLKVIAYTSLSGSILVENLLSLGVKAYVNKKQRPQDVMMAMNEVLNGQIYLPDDYSFLNKKAPESYNTLSEREVEVLLLIAKEYTSSKIAEELNLSVNTIESHRKNIFKKLQVKNVAGMVMEAARLGYLT